MSFDDDADCIGKIGDFGISQHVSPYCVTILGNIEETAPETWGDLYNIRRAVSYDEKSDTFSFAIIVWRLIVGLHSDYPQGSPYNLYGPTLRKEIRNVHNAKKVVLRIYLLQGLRPTIPDRIDETLSALMNRCWRLMPSERPSFSEIVSILVDLYERIFTPLKSMKFTKKMKKYGNFLLSCFSFLTHVA